ncbi:MAG: hypothetical protein QM433_09065 [Euryarchaeota archaeon]|nr:hypothetical protein [Euryarchaeota archaeon]
MAAPSMKVRICLGGYKVCFWRRVIFKAALVGETIFRPALFVVGIGPEGEISKIACGVWSPNPCGGSRGIASPNQHRGGGGGAAVLRGEQAGAEEDSAGEESSVGDERSVLAGLCCDG